MQWGENHMHLAFMFYVDQVILRAQLICSSASDPTDIIQKHSISLKDQLTTPRIV